MTKLVTKAILTTTYHMYNLWIYEAESHSHLLYFRHTTIYLFLLQSVPDSPELRKEYILFFKNGPPIFRLSYPPSMR